MYYDCTNSVLNSKSHSHSLLHRCNVVIDIERAYDYELEFSKTEPSPFCVVELRRLSVAITYAVSNVRVTDKGVR